MGLLPHWGYRLITVRTINHATSFADMPVTSNYQNVHSLLHDMAWFCRTQAPCDHAAISLQCCDSVVSAGDGCDDTNLLQLGHACSQLVVDLNAFTPSDSRDEIF